MAAGRRCASRNTRDRDSFTELYTDDGATSRFGPMPSRPEGWPTLVRAQTESVLRRRADARAGIDSGRTQAAQHGPFQAYVATRAATSGATPRLRSWRIVDTIEADDAPALPARSWVEIWTAPVADGPISYSALGVAYDQGQIVAIAALEGMPDSHDDLYFCLFAPSGLHENFGQHPELSNLDAFAAAALTVLAPLLGRPLDEPATLAAAPTIPLGGGGSHEEVDTGCPVCREPMLATVQRCDVCGRFVHLHCWTQHVHA